MDLDHPVHRRTFWAVLILGMALRLLWVWAVPMEPVSDSQAYNLLAHTLAEHGVYGFTPSEPGAYWAVGTAAIAAATYILIGPGYEGVVALNLLAGFLIILLTQGVAVRYIGAGPSVMAAAIVAVWPNLIFFTSILSSELYFLALSLAGLWFWGREAGSTRVNLILCGVIWGLACYVRPVILLVPVALLLAELPRGLRAFAGAGLRTVGVLALVVAVVLPWTLRNDRVLGAPVLVSTNFGPNLWMGNNPASTGGYMALPAEVQDMGEVERARYLGDQAKAYMAAHPAATALRTLVKAARLHSRETIGVVWNEAALRRGLGDLGVTALKLVSSGFWYAVLLAALTGVAICIRSVGLFAALFNPIFALWAYFTALHAVIVVEDRYHMPSSPYIAMFAAIALNAAWARRQNRNRAPEAA